MVGLVAAACAAQGLPDVQGGASPAPAGPPRLRFGRHNVPAWPVYFSWDWEGDRSLRVFGPVTSLYREPRYTSFYPVFPVTGMRRWRDGRRADHVLWPLLYAESDPARGTWSANLATPLVGVRSVRSPGYHRLSFLPLYDDEKTPTGRRAFMLTPFHRRVQEPLGHRLDETWGFVALGSEPLFWLHRRWRHENGHGWNTAWAYGAWSTDSSRYRVLPPWIGYDQRLSGSSRRFRMLAPVFADYRRRDLSGARTDARSLLLLHYTQSDAGADGDTNRFMMTLPFHVASRRTGSGHDRRLALFLPVYGAWRSPERALRVALPSWWSYRSPSLASRGLWPLYASFERTRADSSKRSGASFAWPLVTWGRGDDYSAFGVLPLFLSLRDGDMRFATAPPLYWRLRGREREWLIVAPFYASRRAPGTEWRVLAPFYTYLRNPAETREVVFDWYRISRRGFTRTGLAPFYDRAGSADSGSFFVPPLLAFHSWSPAHEARWVALVWGDWRSKVDGSRTRLFGPVITTRGPGTSGFGVLPVFYTTRGPASRRTLVGPVFASSNSAGVRHLVIAPLAWQRSDPGGWAIDLLPLTGYRTRHDGRSLLYVLGPTYVRRVRSPTDRTSALLGWLARDETRGTRRRAMLQPLWYLERKSADEVFVSLLGGLLGSYEHAGMDRQVKVMFVPVRRWTR
jgi:hypothetical protein